jgi:PPE-repeat protein
MLPNFSVLPPEINSARVFGGAGPAPMLEAAAAWERLAADLRFAATSFWSVSSGLAGQSWQGPASLAMANVAAPYVGWLSTSAVHAESAAILTRLAASEFETAMAATVHPTMIMANRAEVVSLIATNLFGQNAPAIAAIETLYEGMWAQDVSAMAGYYVGAAAVAAQVAPWPQQLQSLVGAATHGAGLAVAGMSDVSMARPVNSSLTANPAAAQTVGLVMGGSGIPIPSLRYAARANALYISRSVADAIAQSLFTPEGLYPVIAIKNLTFDASVAQGVTILDSAIRQQIAAGDNVTVFGYSQSATIASLTMANLAGSVNAPTPDQLSFTLIGNPNNPNGGVATRFPEISFPSLGVTATGPTPDNLYPTKIYTIEYDGVADFPRYPINVFSTLNAIAGAYYVHSNYLLLTPEQIDSAVHLTNTVGPTMTDYYVIRTENLPLLEPLRGVPILGNPLADLIQPNMKVMVNLGYGDPAYGYSTSPPNVNTPFGLFPEISPITVFDALAAGTQQGINDFSYDIRDLDLPVPAELPSLMTANPAMALGMTSGTGADPSAAGVWGPQMIDSVQAANTKLANTVTNVAETSYATLLPTADIVNAVVTTAPSYNINLFLDGIEQAVNGDPMGLVNAVGYPVAADVALLLVAGLLQVLIVVTAGQTISGDITGLLA